MTTTRKRHRVSNLKLMEISTVDHPAQTGAVAVLLKGADSTYASILKSAAAVLPGESPAHSRDQYEAAMFDRAKVLAKEQGLTKEQALSRNLTTDDDLRELTNAYEHANAALYGEAIRKKYGTAA